MCANFGHQYVDEIKAHLSMAIPLMRRCRTCRRTGTMLHTVFDDRCLVLLMLPRAELAGHVFLATILTGC